MEGKGVREAEGMGGARVYIAGGPGAWKVVERRGGVARPGARSGHVARSRARAGAWVFESGAAQRSAWRARHVTAQRSRSLDLFRGPAGSRGKNCSGPVLTPIADFDNFSKYSMN